MLQATSEQINGNQRIGVPATMLRLSVGETTDDQQRKKIDCQVLGKSVFTDWINPRSNADRTRFFEAVLPKTSDMANKEQLSILLDSECGLIDSVVEQEPNKASENSAIAEEPGPEPDKRRTLKSYSLAEMAGETFDLDYVVDGILVDQQPFIFAGKDKCLKSTIMLELAISIGTGKPFLDRWDVLKPQPVVFLSAESGLATLKDKARASLHAKGMSLRDADQVTITDEIINITSERDIDAIETLMLDRESSLLMIDPAYLVVPGDQSSNLQGQGDILRKFTARMNFNGFTWGICHHAKKNHPIGEPLERSDMSGAGWGEYFRQWMLFNHRTKPDMEAGNFELWMNFGGSAGHSGCVGLDIHEGIFNPRIQWREWKCEIVKASDCWQEKRDQEVSASNERTTKKQEAKIQQARKDIAELLNGGPATQRQIRDFAGQGMAVARAIKQLLDENQIELTTIETGNNNRRCEAYQWTETTGVELK